MIGKIFGSNSNGTGSAGRPMNGKFKIGDRVQVPDGEWGHVRGIQPDGTLIVSLASRGKSRSIFPSFLKKVAD